MPKMKTHKGSAKRFKVSGGGKVMFHRAGKGHLLSTKSGRRKQRLRRPGVLHHAAIARKIKWMLGEK